MTTPKPRVSSAKLFGFLSIYEYPGLLGLRTLKPFSVTIDLAGSRLALRPKGAPSPEGALVVPFELRFDNMFLLAHLNGQGPFRLLLDPGAPSTVVAPRVAQRLGLDPQKPFRLDLEVEGQRIAEGLGARVVEFLEEAKLEDGMVIDGLLGRNFLKRWVVTIDFDRQKSEEAEWDALMGARSQIAVPILFIFGRHDYLVSIERAQLWAAKLKRAEMAIFEESCHHPFIDEPLDFARQVNAFLRR